MFLTTFVIVLFRILEFAVLVRVIMSWINPAAYYTNAIFRLIWQITEPILAPLRQYTTFGMMDLSPIVALIGLQILQSIILQLLAGVR
jgi:YggT family protein